MRSDLRVVFDTNTLISAFLLPKSLPRQALDIVTAAGRLLLSTATATEITEVLRQPKFDRYLSEHRRMTLLAVVIHNADLVEVDATITVCRDPMDNKLLDLSVSGRATHLVTGDQDLLILSSRTKRPPIRFSALGSAPAPGRATQAGTYHWNANMDHDFPLTYRRADEYYTTRLGLRRRRVDRLEQAAVQAIASRGSSAFLCATARLKWRDGCRTAWAVCGSQGISGPRREHLGPDAPRGIPRRSPL